jgi:hypothetical protein
MHQALYKLRRRRVARMLPKFSKEDFKTSKNMVNRHRNGGNRYAWVGVWADVLHQESPRNVNSLAQEGNDATSSGPSSLPTLSI